ncbi:MAG: YdcF family protein [Clostridiales bacterium]|nr:YdcF family protein [Clostridiales bacterium]
MNDVIRAITQFIFVKDRPQKADVIMVAGGSSPDLPEYAASLYHQGMAPLIMIGGAYSIKKGFFAGPSEKRRIYQGPYQTECDFYADVLAKRNVPPQAVIGEHRSMFTKQNAAFAKETAMENGLFFQKAILVCRPYHARRCSMYYRLFFSETDFYIAPPPACSPKHDDWYKTADGTALVLGELARIGQQFDYADIKKFD